MPGFYLFQRLLVLPHMMRNSCMPRMINMKPYLFPFDGDLLMTGLPPVHLLGTPKYTHLSREQGCNPIRLCVPKILVNHLFHDPTSPLETDQTLISNLMQGVDHQGADHPIEITRGILKSGRIWRTDFSEIALRCEPPDSRVPPLQMLDPHLNFLDDLSPDQRYRYLHHR